MVEFASDAAMAIGTGSRVVAWNRRATDLLGYSPDHVIGRPCYDVLRALRASGEPLCTPACEGRYCFDHCSPFAVHECALRHRDGRLLPASIGTLLVPAPAAKGALSSTTAVVFLRPKARPEVVGSRDPRLKILTLGRFDLSVADHELPVERWHRKQALGLLKLLVTCRRCALHREQVIESLWPEADQRQGRERLKVTTHFLRRQLRAAGVDGDIVGIVDGTFALRHDAVWLDCEAFENLFDEGRALEEGGQSEGSVSCFESARRLYQGDYLPGERYTEWCAMERERLREIYFDILTRLADFYLREGDSERAARVCRLALSQELCRESFHRGLMICLSWMGQRDRAIAQYNECRKALDAELAVEPTPATQRLYRDIVANRRIDVSAARLRR